MVRLIGQRSRDHLGPGRAGAGPLPEAVPPASGPVPAPALAVLDLGSGDFSGTSVKVGLTVRRQLWVAGVGGAVVLVVAGLWSVMRWAPLSGVGDGTVGAAPGTAVVGSAQPGRGPGGGAGATGSPVPGITGGPGLPGPGLPPGLPGVTRQPPGSGAPGEPPTISAPVVEAQLRATVTVRKVGLSTTVEVTVHNSGDVAGDWHTVALRLTGLNLSLTGLLDLTHVLRDGLHLFTPTAPILATVPAKGSARFTFTVLALTSVLDCSLDGFACDILVLV